MLHDFASDTMASKYAKVFMRAEWLLIGSLFVSALTGLPDSVQGALQSDGDESDSILTREAAARRISWQAEGGPIEERGRLGFVKILAINDFHGQLSAGRRIDRRPVGGAAVLASYLKKAQNTPPDSNVPESTLIVHAGDHVGASTPESSFFQDEPSITFLNQLANQHCTYADRMNPQCNLVGTLGNHEFDEGQAEMLRLIRGGTHKSGPFFEAPYRGARFPYVSANVVDKSGQPILPPFVIKEVQGVRLAFVGAVLKETPTIVTSTGVEGLAFLDEAESINRYVEQLRQTEGIHAFIVLIHQGGRQTSYEGPTQPGAIMAGQEITKIIESLDDDVDVVVSGHSHAFTNTVVKNRNRKNILVTQALSYGTAYADIRLTIDQGTGEVIEKSAAVVSTYADAGPGLMPDPTVKQLVSLAEQKVAPLVTRVIGQAAADIPRAENEAGESALGNLIADAQRAALKTDFAFMNPGGIRTDVLRDRLPTAIFLQSSRSATALSP
jgi:5'-nucleotidase